MLWLLGWLLAIQTVALIVLVVLIRTLRDTLRITQIITLPDSIFPLEPSGDALARKKVEAAVLERP